MAPSAITEDYYMILEVDPNAGLELIVRSYKRLALKLHPDRNSERNATEAFQQLGRAYETLKDESERREYDLIYPFLKGKAASSQLTREPKTTSEPVSTASETAQIAVLRSFKQERATRWWTSMIMFDASISDAERAIRRLEQEINGLASIAAAEAAVEAKRNSWSTWLLSPLYTKAEDSEEVKAEKDRARQERRIERDMKERRVEAERAKLKATKADMENSRSNSTERNEKRQKQGDNNKRQSFLQNSDKKRRKLENGERLSKNLESSKKSLEDNICIPHSPARPKAKLISMAR
ncbi:hypothetical protein N0V91_011029 [Didymella pomorum]|uniref:J domain-containing protein n=1 Tax=Didymella pomorum TaxID=749634 RepID=A0A9W8Z0S4_9PLEO|nr:hypothetical protein N0V91_011029 [Didymella pomorum]